MAELLRLLLRVSEKAANVARVCRQEAPLFELLVQEKTGEDKNKKFVQDFKTLADVVIQEMIKHDVGAQFPELKDFIHGEESNKFENGLDTRYFPVLFYPHLHHASTPISDTSTRASSNRSPDNIWVSAYTASRGESITVTVRETEEETAALLSTVLDGDRTAAALLATAIHQDLQLVDQAAGSLELPLRPHELGIWIDPIDATSQYIEGREEKVPEGELCTSGLQCALVLIGIYHRATGEPIMGVINQPFAHRESSDQRWRGQHFWGVSCGTISASSLPRPPGHTGRDREPLLVLSASEKQAVKDALSGSRLTYASGAGYKILCVALGLADAYVVSEGSTFKWDSCAPHALLRALGGGVVDLAACLGTCPEDGGHPLELTYHQPRPGCQGAERWANHGGMVAYLEPRRLMGVIGALQGKI
ncbi:inositol polyphosphate 1-phosphatase isoform X1 [Megalops cyprinoides]|uniref:inositol polyphosphate 1-phosphatase isoform X1 n=1 Tax=Megalops cyprinoides TaxID=118141 RepID=UPI001863B12F|nr:inositol polyphosphate 1-phosphatase isoform X1 [Megalops cyprinoides]